MGTKVLALLPLLGAGSRREDSDRNMVGVHSQAAAREG